MHPPRPQRSNQQSQQEPDVAHEQLVLGLSVAEIVEAGEVPGSKKMTTLSCRLGSNGSWPRKYKITCKSRDPASCWQWAQGVLGMICTCIRGKIPTGADLFKNLRTHEKSMQPLSILMTIIWLLVITLQALMNPMPVCQFCYRTIFPPFKAVLSCFINILYEFVSAKIEPCHSFWK